MLALVVLSGCATPRPQATRYLWVTGLKPEKIERYEYLHSHLWPGVNKMIKDCHIQNHSIYEREIDGKTYLFSYLEYTGTKFDADMKIMRLIRKRNAGGRNLIRASSRCRMPPRAGKSGAM